MQKSRLACAIAFTIGVTAATAAAEEKDSVDHFFESIGSFSAEVAGTTDYTFRGISQTNEGPAIQGSFGWSKDFTIGGQKFGAFASAWASNVDFDDGDNAHIEIDYSGGFSTEVSGVTLEAFAIYYNYPNSASELEYDYVEAGGGIGYDFGVASVASQFYWSPDFFGGIGDAYYIAGDVSIPLPFKLTLDGHVGHSFFDNSGSTDYTDWSIAVTRSILGFDLSLAYVDTDLSESECGSENCDPRAVFTVAKSF